MLIKSKFLLKNIKLFRCHSFIPSSSLYTLVQEQIIFSNGKYNLYKYDKELSLNSLNEFQLQEIEKVKKIPLSVLKDYKSNYNRYIEEKQKNTVNPVNIFLPSSPSTLATSLNTTSISLPTESHLVQFAAGRYSVKQLINQVDPSFSISSPLIYNDKEAYPKYPSKLVASLSHKDNYMSSVVLSPSSIEKESVGIDLENLEDKRGLKISRKILTPNEIDIIFKCSLDLSSSPPPSSSLVEAVKSLQHTKTINEDKIVQVPLTNLSFNQHILLIFSIKEAFYKAIYPYYKSYIGFQEVEVIILDIEKNEEEGEEDIEKEREGKALIFFKNKQFKCEIIWKIIEDIDNINNKIKNNKLCLSFVQISSQYYHEFHSKNC